MRMQASHGERSEPVWLESRYDAIVDVVAAICVVVASPRVYLQGCKAFNHG